MHQQTTLYHINLPQFLLNFKQQVVKLIVPHLLQVRAIINSQRNSNTVNPIIFLFSLVVVLYIVKSIWCGLFGKRDSERNTSTKDLPQLNAEINELKKQLKSLKSSFNELIKQIPQQHNTTINTQPINNISQNQSLPPSHHKSNQLWSQVLPLYTTSLENNKKLVNYVLESQFQMLRQLKRFKKAQRASLSSGRPSTSTIRSKTSEKKLENSISKSPHKISGNNTTTTITSSIQKPQIIKSSQRSIRSQIYQKHTEKKTTEGASFLMKQQQQSQMNETRTKVQNGSTTQTRLKIQEKNRFEKVQTTFKQNKTMSIQQQTSVPSVPNEQSEKNAEYEKPSISLKSHTQYSSLSVESKTQQMHVETPLALNSEEPAREEISSNVGISDEEIQGSAHDQPQLLQEAQVFVPVKIPVIKKLNPPKQGAKRPPPPPPKK